MQVFSPGLPSTFPVGGNRNFVGCYDKIKVLYLPSTFPVGGNRNSFSRLFNFAMSITLAKHFPGRRESKLTIPIIQVTAYPLACQALSRSEGIETYDCLQNNRGIQLAKHFPGRRESKRTVSQSSPGIAVPCQALSRSEGIETKDVHTDGGSSHLAKHFPGRRESKLNRRDFHCQNGVVKPILTCQALSRSEGIETRSTVVSTTRSIVPLAKHFPGRRESKLT